MGLPEGRQPHTYPHTPEDDIASQKSSEAAWDDEDIPDNNFRILRLVKPMIPHTITYLHTPGDEDSDQQSELAWNQKVFEPEAGSLPSGEFIAELRRDVKSHIQALPGIDILKAKEQ